MSDSALERFDMQALLRGFGASWPWALFAYGAFGDNPKRNREFLKGIPAALGRNSGPTSVSELDAGEADPRFEAAFNVAFTYSGLAKLGIAPDVLSSFAPEYIQGMRKRADINHDHGRSSPELWERHWRDGAVDFWIGVYAGSEPVRGRAHESLRRHLASFDMSTDWFDLPARLFGGDGLVWIDDPDRQPEATKMLEHFGFQDGVSNPPIKGFAPPGAATTNSGGKLDPAGNWQPIAAGEFIYGHLDEIGEIPAGPAPTDIAINGTYMVLRKLSQDVDAFRSYVVMLAKRHGMLADELAEKLVGRKRNGEPLVQTPFEPDANDFLYGDDTDGSICPLGSHVRRTNPRDSLGFDTLLVDRHRIIRRGIPYGALVPREKKQTDVNPLDSGDRGGERVDGGNGNGPYPGQGLMFIALNIDIRRQFEFVQSQWVNQGNDINQGSNRDPVAGSHNPEHPKHNRIVLPTESEEGVMVCPEIPSFVETRGGDYFFLPGLHAYRCIVEGRDYR